MRSLNSLLSSLTFLSIMKTTFFSLCSRCLFHFHEPFNGFGRGFWFLDVTSSAKEIVWLGNLLNILGSSSRTRPTCTVIVKVPFDSSSILSTINEPSTLMCSITLFVRSRLTVPSTCSTFQKRNNLQTCLLDFLMVLGLKSCVKRSA